MKKQTYDIFISYRREGGESAAQTIYDRLTEIGYHVFLDRESLNSGDFDTRIYSVIDQCRDFLVILSPDALTRCQDAGDWVRREAEYALLKEKNVIPVMMKGFTFPETLPPSLSALPSKNGILLNYDFFDAFLTKLESFLKASPDFLHSIRRNRLVHKTLPLFLALFLVMAIGLIGRQIYVYVNSNYPFTAAEKNLTSEYLAYVTNNLMDFNQAAEILSNIYDECAYYYQSPGSLSSYEVSADLDTAIYKLTQLDTSAHALSDELKEKLSDSPFDITETEALHTWSVSYVSGAISDLYFIQKVIRGEAGGSDYDAARTVSLYTEFNEQELLALSYATNESLLVITNPEALSLFKEEILPLLQELTLTSVQWSDNKEALQAAQDGCYESMQRILTDLAAITGSTNVELNQLDEQLMEQLMELGYSKEEAEAQLDRLDEKANQLTINKDRLEQAKQALEEAKAELRRKFAPSLEDDIGTLWGKMLRFLHAAMYDEALNCVDYIRETQRETDEYSPIYTAACASFIKSIGKTGIDYGLMIVGYDPDNVNAYYEIGDVIISYNGFLVRNITEYDAAKASRPETGSVKIGVMRLNDEGVWEYVTLDMPVDAPGVYMANMTEKTYD